MLDKIRKWLTPAGPQTRRSKPDVIAIAQAYLEEQGRTPLREPIGCGPFTENGRVVWRLHDNMLSKGGNVRLLISDEDGQVLECRVMPR